jgi:hypothetical protein
MSMHQILADVASAIAGVLERELPQVGKDWWQSCVVAANDLFATFWLIVIVALPFILLIGWLLG